MSDQKMPIGSAQLCHLYNTMYIGRRIRIVLLGGVIKIIMLVGTSDWDVKHFFTDDLIPSGLALTFDFLVLFLIS